jgi:phosphoserine phosphatase RsbU/P
MERYESGRRLERCESDRCPNRELCLAEHSITLTLQDNFIHPLPSIEGLEMAAVSETAEDPQLVGGDFHAALPLADGRALILLGDVEGKGARAAGSAETVRTAVNSFGLVNASPKYILDKTNELLLGRPRPDEPFVTAFLLALDLRTGEVSYASAGHPPPVIVKGSSCDFLETDFGVPLGTFTHNDYVVGHVALAQGDSVVLYTAGVTEARRGSELFGERRLIEVLHATANLRPDEVASALRNAAVEHASRLTDDLQVLVLRLAAPN